MGSVWAGCKTGDHGFQRLFAIKVLKEEIAGLPSFRRMFFEEARIAARIRHTHVVAVLDVGEQEGVIYQVMDLVEGASLSHLMDMARGHSEGARLSPSIGVRILSDALRGLHAAHELCNDAGVPYRLVHRDVSPHNILVGMDGVSKIADFGVAKAVDSLAEETETGEVKGKLSYMAPEQLDKRPLDRRSDLFSMGIVLWEWLAGTRLTPAAAPSALAGKVPTSPKEHNPSAPFPLVEVALRALRSDPQDRYPTADAMADALEKAAHHCHLQPSAKEVAAWVKSFSGADVRNAGAVDGGAPARPESTGRRLSSPTLQGFPNRSREKAKPLSASTRRPLGWTGVVATGLLGGAAYGSWTLHGGAPRSESSSPGSSIVTSSFSAAPSDGPTRSVPPSAAPHEAQVALSVGEAKKETGLAPTVAQAAPPPNALPSSGSPKPKGSLPSKAVPPSTAPMVGPHPAKVPPPSPSSPRRPMYQNPYEP